MVPCFPLLGLTPSGLFIGLSSIIIYTSELILCSTICVPSATRHNIHMYPLLRLTPSGLFMGLSSTIIYTSELILCSTICVPSATRHNIHMYPYFLFAAVHHLKSSPTFSVRPCSSVGRVTGDLIRRSRVRFPPRSKDFFLCLVSFRCFPLLGLTPSGLFMGLSSTIIVQFRIRLDR